MGVVAIVPQEISCQVGRVDPALDPTTPFQTAWSGFQTTCSGAANYVPNHLF